MSGIPTLYIPHPENRPGEVIQFPNGLKPFRYRNLIVTLRGSFTPTRASRMTTAMSRTSSKTIGADHELKTELNSLQLGESSCRRIVVGPTEERNVKPNRKRRNDNPR